MSASADPVVSVIVPAHNAADEIRALLNSLEHQTASRDLFEVLVVDDCSTDATSAVVADSCFGTPLPGPGRGSYAARNVALGHARGSVLAFTDSDCRPRHDWIERGLAALDRGADLIAGHIHVPLGEQPSAAALVDAAVFFDQRRYAELGFGATANLWTYRRVFDRVGPFNDRLVSGGDTEFGMRATAAGMRAEYDPEVIIEHAPRAHARELARKSFRVGVGAAQHLVHAEGPLRERDRYWARPGSWIPKGGLKGLDRLAARGIQPGPLRRARMYLVQYSCVKLASTVGNLAGDVRGRGATGSAGDGRAHLDGRPTRGSGQHDRQAA